MSEFQRALGFAFLAHEGQVRKTTGEAYIYHPLSVARAAQHFFPRTCRDYPDLPIVALFHDVIEDTKVTKSDIEADFTYGIAYWTEQCTDTPNLRGNERRAAKLSYLRTLTDVNQVPSVVMLCDTWHNLKSCHEGFIEYGDEAFANFGGGPNIIYYYAEKAYILNRNIEEASPCYIEICTFIDDLRQMLRLPYQTKVLW